MFESFFKLILLVLMLIYTYLVFRLRCFNLAAQLPDYKLVTAVPVVVILEDDLKSGAMDAAKEMDPKLPTNAKITASNTKPSTPVTNSRNGKL